MGLSRTGPPKADFETCSPPPSARRGNLARDGVGNEIVADRIGVPIVALHVDTTECFYRQIYRLPAWRLRHVNAPDVRYVEPFPPPSRSAVRIHIEGRFSRLKRGRMRPYTVADSLVPIRP